MFLSSRRVEAYVWRPWKIRSIFELRSRSCDEPSRSYSISVDALGRHKHNETKFTYLALLNCELPPKNTGDLRWPQMAYMKVTDKTLPLNNQKWLNITPFSVNFADIMRIGRIFLPLPYNADVTKLTLPYFIKIHSPEVAIRVVDTDDLTISWKFHIDPSSIVAKLASHFFFRRQSHLIGTETPGAKFSGNVWKWCLTKFLLFSKILWGILPPLPISARIKDLPDSSSKYTNK